MRQWIEPDAEIAGVCPERLARIAPALQAHVGPGRLSGVQTLLWRRGRLVHELSLGHLDRDQAIALPDRALFRIFSMTKPVTSVLALMLVERGRLRLDTPVARILPAFAQTPVLETDAQGQERLVAPRRPLVVHDLLTHQSGLSYHYHEYGAVEARYRGAGISADLPLAEFVDRLAALPLAFHPGASWRYGYSHDVLAALIERLEGVPFETLLQTRIFDPLGMHDTGFIVAPERQDRLATPYGAGSIADPTLVASQLVAAATAGTNVELAHPHDRLESGPAIVARGGHGLVSSTHDYLQFCRMLLGHGQVEGVRLLGRKAVELMTMNHLAPTLLPYEIGGLPRPGYGYGLGVRVMMDVAASRMAGSVGEFGWSGVASTYFWVDPQERMIGIQMAQFLPNGVHLVDRDYRALAYASIID